MKDLRRFDRRRWTVLSGVLAFAVAGCAPGESGDAPDAETNGSEVEAEVGAEVEAETEAPRIVAEGSTMVFRVDDAVSTESHEVGDAFTARLAEPVRATDGSVALPAGTSSEWVVTRSETSGGETLLAFGLRSVQVGATSVPIEATVTDTEVQADAGDSGTESAAKVAVGAAAGALIGQILGRDTESTLTGAGVGAIVGTVVALTTRGGEARLAPGSTITVRLDQTLEAS